MRISDWSSDVCSSDLHYLHRLGLADRAGEALRAAHARRYAELDLRLAEFRGVGGKDEVAHHRHLTTAAERIARDRRDHGFARLREAFPAGEMVGAVHLGKAHVGHFLDVRTRSERLVAAGEDRAPLPRSEEPRLNSSH